MVFTTAMNATDRALQVAGSLAATMLAAIQRAIEILGSQAQLAKACNQKPQAVTRWLRTGKVPANHCLAIEVATKGAVTCQDLRPDVFGRRAPGKQAAA